MAEFYVEKNATKTGEHLVHSKTCSSLPAEETMHYLGAYSNALAPVKEANDRYVKVAACRNCLAH